MRTADAQAQLMVAVTESRVWIKVTGRATFQAGNDFKTLIYSLREQGLNDFWLDLTDCLAMDSTFSGILAGFVRLAAETPGSRVEVHLVNANRRIADFLENLDALRLFKVVCCGASPVALYEAVASRQVSKEEITRLCLEAHQTLMDLNPNNIPKFKEVTRFLAEDLKTQDGGAA